MKQDSKWYPTAEYRFFLYDPEGDRMQYFKSLEERDAAAENAVAAYLDDGWSEEVEQVACGEVTHFAQCLDKTMRPPQEELDADGCDHEGNSWSDFEWRGNYKMEPVNAQTKAPTGGESGK